MAAARRAVELAPDQVAAAPHAGRAPAQPAEVPRGRGRARARDRAEPRAPKSPTSRWPAIQVEQKAYRPRPRACCSGSPSGSRAWPRPSSCSGGSRSRPSSGTRRSRASAPRSSSTPTTTAPGPRSATSTGGAPQERRGGRGLPARRQGQPGQSGVRRAAGGPPDPARPLPEAQTELEALAEVAPAEPARVDEARRRLLRAEDVGQRHRRVSPRGGARADQSARPLLPGHHLHGRRPRRRGASPSWSASSAPTRGRSTPASSSASSTAGPSATTRRSSTLREAVNLEPKRPELFLYLGTRVLPGQAVRPRRPRRCRKGWGSTTSRRICTSSSASSTRSSAVRRRGRLLPARDRARSQARRGLQLRRLHVRRARPEPRRGDQAHHARRSTSSPRTATSSTVSAGRTTSRGAIRKR